MIANTPDASKSQNMYRGQSAYSFKSKREDFSNTSMITRVKPIKVSRSTEKMSKTNRKNQSFLMASTLHGDQTASFHREFKGYS